MPEGNSYGRSGLLVGPWEHAISPPVGLSDTALAQKYRPDAASMAKLRAEQARFGDVKNKLERENAWLAVPALAPIAVVAGLELAALSAARAANAVVKRPPHDFTAREPLRRGGDSHAARRGRRFHAELRRRVEQKLDWESEPSVPHENGGTVKPDLRTPARVRPKGGAPRHYQMELKPDTPSGRKAAARALRKYKGTGVKTRAIFYDPKSKI